MFGLGDRLGPECVGLDPWARWAVQQSNNAEIEAGVRAMDGAINIGSLCSGMDMGVLCASAIAEAWNDPVTAGGRCRTALKVCHVFSCERNEAKRRSLRRQSPDCKHLWRDIREVATGMAYCDITGRVTRTIGCDLLQIGWSCTSLSVMNPVPAAFDDASTSSGETYKAGFEYIKRHRPRWVMQENVLAVSAERRADRAAANHPREAALRPVQRILADMRSLGYQGGFAHVCTAAFGLPQRRWRVYMVFELRTILPRAVALQYAEPDPVTADVFEGMKK